MSEKKITKREILTSLLSEDLIKNNANYKEYCENELQLLDNRKNSKKQNEAQELNNSLKNTILTGLAGVTVGMTVTDIMKKCNINPFEISGQRVTSVLSTMSLEGSVIATKDGKKTLYKLS